MTTHSISLKDRQRQERERLILQAAESVLAEQGYDAMSMEEVANRVGISRAAVYLHFPSKEDLVFAVLEHGVRLSVEHLDTLLADTSSPREKVRAVIERTYGGMAQPAFQAFNATLQSPTFMCKVRERREMMRDLWGPTRQRLTMLLDEGKRSGDFDPEMPTSLMVTLLTGLLTPFSHKRMVEQEQMPLDVGVDFLCRYFLRGIAPDRLEEAPVKLPGTTTSEYGAEPVEAIDK
jgi:TetR/AcrR family transcriptional regulator, fatty acid metabolism regulator protein